MKNNPLFVDSTKFRGETIIAEIEVCGVELLPEESLYTKVTLHTDQAYAVKLEPKLKGRFSGRMRLSYQEELLFQHIILRGDQTVAETPPKRFKVNYTIQDRWERKKPDVTENTEDTPHLAKEIKLTTIDEDDIHQLRGRLQTFLNERVAHQSQEYNRIEETNSTSSKPPHNPSLMERAGVPDITEFDNLTDTSA